MASTHYKLRGEFEHDIEVLKVFLTKEDPEWKILEFEIDKYLTPTLSFTTKLTPEQLDKIISNIDDGHVMLETLNYEDKYTGERTYSGFSWIFGGDENLEGS